MHNPKVHVVLLNWNGHEDTYRCLSSLKYSSYPVKVIVVDNCSTERDIEQVALDFPEIKLIQSTENGGFSKGNNLGILAALADGADYVYILNNDTVVTDETISLLVQFLESHEDAVAASPLVLYGDEPDLIWYGGGAFSWIRGGARSSRFNAAVSGVVINGPEEVGFISGCSMFIRSDALRKTGGFDEEFFMYVEDVDLSLRLTHVGKLYFVPSAIIFHFAHSTAKKDSRNIFRNPSSYLNPNLNFYLHHVLSGYYYLLNKHKPHIISKVGFIVYFNLRWIKNALSYLYRGRVDSFLLVIKELAVRTKI